MEVGAVKQAFNNEIILLKKKLIQAKVQVISKLTRKAKTFAEKKAPEPLKEKLKRKAVSAVNEVMIIKKIKAREIGKFIVTHTGQLQDYLNKPQVDHNKACARLLLHKALQDKYKFIRSRFTDVPIKDLFMSRQERLKLKKEARDKKMEKKKRKANKILNAKGDWNVEDIEMGDDGKELSDKDESCDENELLGDENEFSSDTKASDDGISEQSNSGNESDQNSVSDNHEPNVNEDIDHESENEETRDNENETETKIGNFVRLYPVKKQIEPTLSSSVKLPASKIIESKFKAIEKEIKKKQEIKHKDTNKNKNINEKILQRKFKKESNVAPIQENKVVDPFFITSTGDNYLSVAEPRQPDEVKEVHKQGNRKLRRAKMFGHVPKSKPRQDKFRAENDRFNHSNSFDRPDNKTNSQNAFKRDRFDSKDNFNDRKSNFEDRNANKRNNQEESKPEKLHPSWEAKKRQSGILPFQGKKIVFDET